MKNILLLAALTLLALVGKSQVSSKRPFAYSHRLSIMAGLIQPIALRGGNVELTYTTERMIFDYSHGFNLNPPSMGESKSQNIVSHLPFSTGFGIGYRILPYLDIRLEPKLHSWEVYYAHEGQTLGNRIVNYKTFTIGAGIYYRYFPFRNSPRKSLQGITTATSLRFWPNIGTTLRKDAFSYDNKTTNQRETMRAANIGMGNTPIIFNISVGYTVGGR